MIDYAKISKMIEYEKNKVFPFSQIPIKPTFKDRIKDITRILIDNGPIRRPYIKSNCMIGSSGIFRYGTRGWEYPWVLEQLMELKKGSKILDCGCGISPMLVELYERGFKPTGFDSFVTKKDKHLNNYGVTDSFRRRLVGKVNFLNGGMAEIPAEDYTFDAAICISVMEHIVIDSKDNPQYHLRCLDEMKRVIKPGGLLICTYDTILNKDVVFGGIGKWRRDGWFYSDDIEYLDMKMKDPNAKHFTREDILMDEDTFFIPPDLYFQLGFGSGFELFGQYHRLTSVGFALIKADL